MNNANTNGGGLVQLDIRQICDQTLDPTNYSSCSSSWGHVELNDLRTFLTWIQAAGQNGGAPAGTTFGRLSQLAAAADTIAPTTTILCNAAACASTPYSGGVTVTLAATDLGAGVSSTHYTTDGSDPTLASPTYTGPFGIGAQAVTTVKYRSWDRAGNAGDIGTQTIQGPVDSAAPQTAIACNGAPCAGPYTSSVSVTLSATDTGGSGVATTYYTTDGSTPTTSSTAYTAAIPLGVGTTTVKFFSVDFAGNAEAVQSQALVVAPPKTVVSLTFDDDTASQYDLGYTHALQPHAAVGTFYVNSGTVGLQNFLTWDELSTLQGAGNQIGGKTTNGVDLTSVDQTTATQQVCGDRQALLAHGLTADAFAYPFGSSNASVEAIVNACGYGSARQGGGLGVGSPTGGISAETLPPTDWMATRSYAPGTVTAANLQAIVSNASAKGGGWVPIVIGRVCDQTLDPSWYGACSTGSNHIELADLNTFLDWLGATGQAGGAPAGTAMQTVAGVAGAADVTAPQTTATCNGTACTSEVYEGGSVRVALTATDLGAGARETHYTTDGSAVTLASPTYTAPITLTAGTTTVQEASWDKAGNAETAHTLTVVVDATPDTIAPTTVAACNGAPCAATAYDGGVTVTLSATDNPGGSGFASTQYTTDGTDPTTSPTAQTYTGAFLLANNTALRYSSVDVAGNHEAVETTNLFMNPYPVTVSLTFDDQYENQWLYLRPLLQQHTMNATFYVITSDSYAPFSCCMSFGQLKTLQDEGNDIGGHGQFHLDLTDPSTTTQEKTTDVCRSRTDLQNNGIVNPTSFGYPFGSSNAAAETIVSGCGFQSGRAGGGISSSLTSPAPPWAESIPPKDPLAIRAIDVDGNTDKKLSDLENFVTAAAIHGGGWVPMIFHQVCNANAADFSTCLAQYGVRDTVLDQFMTWLGRAGQPGGAPAGVQVRTVSQVMTGPDAQAPTTSISCNGAACAPWYSSPVSVSLDATDSGSGVNHVYYTTDGSTPTTSSAVYSGPFTVSQTATVKYFATDLAGNSENVHTRTVGVDTSPPVSSISCNGAPCTGAWSSSTVTVSLAASDGTGSGVTNIYYTIDGTTPTTSSAVYSAPFPVTSASTVRFFATDAAGNAESPQSQAVNVDTTAPVSRISCQPGPCSGSGMANTVTVTLSASDGTGSGVAHIYYTTDGSVPTTASTVYTGPFPVTQSTTLQFFAVDVVGNAESPHTQNLGIDNTAPVSSISCNGAACTTGWYRSAVTVSLSATDSGGSGVAHIYYTTDGRTPTTASTQYSTPFAVSQSTTVQYFATDLAGNTESPHTQNLAVDTAAPMVAFSCNGAACAAGWYTSSPVTVTITAQDTGGSGLANVYYTTDGSTPTTATAVYTAPITVTTTTTVKVLATDVAGSSSTVGSQAVRIDTSAPMVSIACNGAACGSGWFKARPVTVRLTATDNAQGSGVSRIYYTTNGSTPTTASTPYTAPFSVSQNQTVRFFATDVAGNASAPASQFIGIDTAVPSTSITCNGTACSSGWYRTTPVTVALSAADTGGSGLGKIYYTTNGSTPNTSSAVYGTPIALTQTTTVKWFATDLAGNASAVATRTVQIDAAAPSVALTAPASGATARLLTRVTVSASATDAGSGTGTPSGIASVVFYDGTAVIGTDTGSPYSISWTPLRTGTHTLTAVATDRAGNVTTSASRSVTVTP